MPASKTVVTVIGSGPAGHTAAIRAAQLGARVRLVEEGKLGGACLNWACIATKFMIHATDILENARQAARLGLNIACDGADWNALVSRKAEFTNSLGTGLEGMLSSGGIEIVNGTAEITNPELVTVYPEAGAPQLLTTDHIIIASGSTPRRLAVPGASSTGAVFPQGLLSLEKLPESLTMIGGGAVGVEFAYIFSRLGCRVSIVEMMPRIVPAEEAELTLMLERSLKRNGVAVYTDAIVTSLSQAGTRQNVALLHAGTEVNLESEVIAVGIGNHPRLDEASLCRTGVAFNDCGIITDEHLSTSIPSIFAAGDVTGKHMLAHVATMQGKIAAENAMGLDSIMDYSAVPRCVFSRPELAAVGLTEEQAVALGHRVKCGRSPFAATAAAGVRGERRGLVKLVADAETGRLLGMHILGPDAAALIAEGVLALRQGATLADIEGTIHAHPTLSEAVWDAALDADDRAINHRSR
jgi:dihydrolipoamide dehydrogenase